MHASLKGVPFFRREEKVHQTEEPQSGCEAVCFRHNFTPLLFQLDCWIRFPLNPILRNLCTSKTRSRLLGAGHSRGLVVLLSGSHVQLQLQLWSSSLKTPVLVQAGLTVFYSLRTGASSLSVRRRF